jgi:hypothetical protein
MKACFLILYSFAVCIIGWAEEIRWGVLYQSAVYARSFHSRILLIRFPKCSSNRVVLASMLPVVRRLVWGVTKMCCRFPLIVFWSIPFSAHQIPVFFVVVIQYLIHFVFLLVLLLFILNQGRWIVTVPRLV